MFIETILQKNGISFKVIDETHKLKIIKIPNKLHLCYMPEKGNQFQLDRDTFDYLDGNSIPYWLVLQDATTKKHYLIALKKDNNWIKSCFDGCDKDRIYLGKQVLNSAISNEELEQKIKILK